MIFGTRFPFGRMTALRFPLAALRGWSPEPLRKKSCATHLEPSRHARDWHHQRRYFPEAFL
jgi:hypothetical protein